MDILLTQMIQFYLNNATNLHHLTTHSMTVLPHKIWRSYCDHRYVTSLHPMYYHKFFNKMSNCCKIATSVCGRVLLPAPCILKLHSNDNLFHVLYLHY